MANRRPQGNSGGRRMEFNRNDGRKNFGRAGLSPWQGGGPGGSGLPNLLPLGGGSTEATLALASNILNLLQPRQNPVPSLLDMPIRRDFVPNMGRFDRNFGPQRMGNQGNFRRTGNYNRAGERMNNNRKPFKPNDGPRQQNKSSQKKEADSKAKPVKESESEEKKKDESAETETKEDVKKEKETPKTRYDDIHNSLLKCHICNKTMWDGRSFENHLSGRAHAIMMTKTAESYALTADTMRQEFKINEMKRTRKTGQNPPRDFYCAMCDMYAADGGVHRTTVGHRKLKKYLHPTCTSCHKEMPTRIELDEHRLTADHIKNMQDKMDDFTKPKPEVMMISTYSMEQSFLRDGRQRKRRGADRNKNADAAVEGHDNAETQDDGIKKEPVDGEMETEEQKVAKKPIDNENTILDYKEGDDLTHVTPDMIPVYSMERGVGESFLGEFKCIQCRLCNKLLDTEETAAVHLKTWRHHQLFVKSLQPPQQQPDCGTKRPVDSSDDGNWKRRRANTADADADADGDADIARDNIKSEPQDYQHQDGGELNDGDVDMPLQEELEDWEQSIDEILNDEKNGQETGVKEATDEAAEPQPEPQPNQPEPEPQANEPEPKPEATAEPASAPPAPAPSAPAPTPAPTPGNKARGSPRRGRGRGRGRN